MLDVVMFVALAATRDVTRHKILYESETPPYAVTFVSLIGPKFFGSADRLNCAHEQPDAVGYERRLRRAKKQKRAFFASKDIYLRPSKRRAVLRA
jgi:hypothetical protein